MAIKKLKPTAEIGLARKSSIYPLHYGGCVLGALTWKVVFPNQHQYWLHPCDVVVANPHYFNTGVFILIL